MLTATTDAIAVRGLSKHYLTRDGRLSALERIAFDVAEGEFIAVVPKQHAALTPR
jgi:ABC-type glutathione transport system ATPase component